VEKLLLTVKEVVELLSISRSAVYALMAEDCDDPLPSFRIGSSRRVSADSLHAWIKRQEEGTTPTQAQAVTTLVAERSRR